MRVDIEKGEKIKCEKCGNEIDPWEDFPGTGGEIDV